MLQINHPGGSVQIYPFEVCVPSNIISILCRFSKLNNLLYSKHIKIWRFRVWKNGKLQ